ncbi:toxin biosynthesis protein [Aspergillus californicus]
MSTTPFTITSRTIDAQYMRDFPHATTTQDAPLRLLVKKYTPVDNPNPQPGDVTLVAFHGAGFPKELYEPLWEETLARCKDSGIRIRAIWFADAANNGASGALNERLLGNDPSWMDHSRDVLHMINHFRDEMPQPLMGVGHSMGTTQLLFLSLIHPRLFTSLILIEPFLASDLNTSDSPLLITMTLRKKDVWPSRELAAQKARKVFPHWDDRVFARWVEHAYRALPTILYPDANTEKKEGSAPVTLTTTKHQEVFMYTRRNLARHQELGLDEKDQDRDAPPHDPLFYPDVMGKLPPGYKFYRSEPMLAWGLLPHVRPSVLYIGGRGGTMEKSGVLGVGAKRTGTRWGGSGGMERGQVRHVTADGAGHDVPFQTGKIGWVAGQMVDWMERGVEKWHRDQARIAEGWEKLSGMEKSVFKEEWEPAWYETVKAGKAKL